MTSRDLRKKNARKEQEREAWADLSSVSFQTRLVGSGEGWIGPILFGRAFARPPQFTYSSVDASGGVQSDLVRPISWPTRSMSSATDSMSWDGWVTDPQFDMQMRWNDPYIPDLDDYLQWLNYQKVWADNSTDPDWPYVPVDDQAGYSDTDPGYVNCWVQSIGPGPRWEIVQAYPYSDDRRGGRYSAQYVFGSETESRRLYPIRPKGNPLAFSDAFPGPFGLVAAGYPNEVYERQIWTCGYDLINSDFALPMGGETDLGPNPPGSPYTFWVAVEASAECEVEVLCRQWVPDTKWGLGDNAWIWHTQLHEEVQVASLAAGQNVVELKFGIPPNYFPNYPPTEDSYYSTWWFMARVTFGLRILGGSAGLRANVQRALVWPNFNDYSGTQMATIGVAEWITNNDGAYVGANLWAKTKDPTLSVAESSAVSASPSAPCVTEDVSYVQTNRLFHLGPEWFGWFEGNEEVSIGTPGFFWWGRPDAGEELVELDGDGLKLSNQHATVFKGGQVVLSMARICPQDGDQPYWNAAHEDGVYVALASAGQTVTFSCFGEILSGSGSVSVMLELYELYGTAFARPWLHIYPGPGQTLTTQIVATQSVLVWCSFSFQVPGSSDPDYSVARLSNFSVTVE